MEEYELEIKNALASKTMLVMDCIHRCLDFNDFNERYNDFYYSAALDGHEANNSQKNVLSKLEHIINFHKEIQTEVIDKVYKTEDADFDFSRFNRINLETALLVMQKIAEKYKAEHLLQNLSEEV